MRLVVIDAEWMQGQIGFLRDRVEYVRGMDEKVEKEYREDWDAHSATVKRLIEFLERADDIDAAVQRRVGEAFMKGIENLKTNIDFQVKGGA